MGKLKGVQELFEGRHFQREIIVLCVRWYLRYKLSLRDLVEMMAERGLSVAHTTICAGSSASRRSSRNAGVDCPQAGRSWRVDETYVKIRGEWIPVSCRGSGR